MGKASNFNRVARRIPSRLKLSLHHDDRSAHTRSWGENEPPRRPITLPTIAWLERPDPDKVRSEVSSRLTIGMIVEI
jgi:hypothetical protein